MNNTTVWETKKAAEEIRKGKTNFADAIIEDNLILRNTTIEELCFRKATIKKDLDLTGATIKYLDLSDATIGGDLYLVYTTIKVGLSLSWKKGPSRIFVTKELAELVHFSAPTTPLVIVGR